MEGLRFLMNHFGLIPDGFRKVEGVVIGFGAQTSDVALQTNGLGENFAVTCLSTRWIDFRQWLILFDQVAFAHKQALQNPAIETLNVLFATSGHDSSFRSAHFIDAGKAGPTNATDEDGQHQVKHGVHTWRGMSQHGLP